MVSHIRSLTGTMNILNADRATSVTENEVSKTIDSNQFNLRLKASKSYDTNECLTCDDDETLSSEMYVSEDEAHTPTKNSPQTTVLNEVEMWKGKKDNIPTRGKYLTICPDINSIHNKPRVTFKIPLLQNGNILRPENIAGKYIMIKNTCAFDSFIQSLLVAYRDWIGYYNYINNMSNEVSFFIRMISTLGTIQKVYKQRALILNNIFQQKSGTIDCACNIHQLISKHLMQDTLSYELYKRCSICDWSYKENIVVTEINIKPIYENGIRNLQECLVQKVNNANKICKRCTNENIINTFQTGTHIFVDIECLQWTEISNRLGYPNWSGTLTLSEIPTDINFCDSTYKLVAAIEYIGGCNENEIGHYITHCRRILEKWETYDDINRNKTTKTTTNRTLLQKKKISLLIFIKGRVR